MIRAFRLNTQHDYLWAGFWRDGLEKESQIGSVCGYGFPLDLFDIKQRGVTGTCTHVHRVNYQNQLRIGFFDGPQIILRDIARVYHGDVYLPL